MFIQINTNTNKIYKAWFTKCPRALTNVKRRGERDEFLSAAYMPSCGVCVCVSVTFVDCVKTNKDIFQFFSPLGSHTILVFPHQTGWQYSDGNPPNGGVECRWGRLKSRNQWLSGLAINNCCTVVCISHSEAGFLFTAGIGRPSAIDALHCTVRARSTKRDLALYIVTMDVNRVYDSKVRRYAEDNRTKSNCTLS